MRRMDQIIQRFQQLMQPFNIHRIVDDGDNTVPWFEVSAQHAIEALIVNEMDIPTQASTIGMEITTWGRFRSLAKRVWDIHERRYRVWRDRLKLQAIEAAEAKGDKKPTEKTIEMLYRQAPEYRVYYGAVERAEEAYNACDLMVEGLKAKKDMLTAYSPMYREHATP